jgi:DNA-binding transcriptional regulator YiaG
LFYQTNCKAVTKPTNLQPSYSQVRGTLKRSIPQDYSARIKVIRQKLGLTQTRMAELMGVSFASVNRWENGQARPSALAWRRIERIEVMGYSGLDEYPLADEDTGPPEPHFTEIAAGNINKVFLAGPKSAETDFYVHPAVMGGTRTLMPGAEAVFTHDSEDEKILMAGLYIHEMLVRGLITRILIITPGNMLRSWEREMRLRFNLSFNMLAGIDASEDNPFKGVQSDLLIASLDLLANDSVFALLREPGVKPYDVAIFDDPHSVAPVNGSSRPFSGVGQLQVAEAFTGVRVKDKRWQLPWRARHLLLLSDRLQRNYVE